MDDTTWARCLRVLPGFWCHASANHAVTTRLLPAGPLETRIEVAWLVDADAEEGVDYELDRLLPFWRLTSEQDWELCERNQSAASSPPATDQTRTRPPARAT